MKTKIRMEHPRLPGQPIYVFPQAAPVHNFSGWQEAPEPPQPIAEPDEEPVGQPTEPAEIRPTATRVQPARRRVVEPTTSIEE